MHFDGLLILSFDRHRFFEVFVLQFGIGLRTWRRLCVLPPRGPGEEDSSKSSAAQEKARCAEGAHFWPATAIGCGNARASRDLAFFSAKGLLHPP